jgi:hypothetical protein
MAERISGLFSALAGWVSAHAWWIAGVSVAYVIVSLIVIRFIIIRMPTDYFLDGRDFPVVDRHPVLAMGVRIGKNILGAVVIVVGLIMSVPGVAGQGILTVLLGLSLMDFPGKRRMELRMVSQPILLKAINRVREKAGKPPLAMPGDEGGGGDRSSHG